MKYKYRLPQMQQFAWLAKLTREYPTNNREVLRVAERWGFKREVIRFLKLFDPDETFYSRADFLTLCSDLKMLIEQKWQQPKEYLYSPQD